jgi:hypothetical protein
MCLSLIVQNLKGIIALRAVKSCSKGILAPIVKHGKSPCFSQVSFLQLVGPDYPLLICQYGDGEKKRSIHIIVEASDKSVQNIANLGKKVAITKPTKPTSTNLKNTQRRTINKLTIFCGRNFEYSGLAHLFRI